MNIFFVGTDCNFTLIPLISENIIFVGITPSIEFSDLKVQELTLQPYICSFNPMSWFNFVIVMNLCSFSAAPEPQNYFLPSNKKNKAQ